MTKPLKRDEAIIAKMQELGEALRGCLVMVADPKSDIIFMSHGGKQAGGKIRTMDGKDHNVVSGVLKPSSFESQSANYLGAVMDVLKSPVTPITSSFWHFLDAALYHISGAAKSEAKKNKRK